MSGEVKVQFPADKGGARVQVLQVESASNSATVTVTALGATALPSGVEVALLVATAPVWIKFGTAGVTITAAESGALLVPAGALYMRVPSTATHYNAIRATGTDAALCVAKVV